MKGGFIIFGINCSIDVAVSTGDFHFGVQIHLEDLENRINHELHLLLLTAPETVNMSRELQEKVLAGGVRLKVDNATLTEFSTSSYGAQKYPSFQMHYDFIGHHHVDFGLPLLDLYNDFKHFWDKYLKSLF